MIVSGFQREAARKTMFAAQTMLRLMLASGTLWLASGCGKEIGSDGAGAPAVSTPAAPPGVPPGGADMESALRELTQAVRKYSVERKQVPKTFGEVVAAGYVQHLPAAPPGKKFEIDAKTRQVVLVKQ